MIAGHVVRGCRNKSMFLNSQPLSGCGLWVLPCNCTCLPGVLYLYVYVVAKNADVSELCRYHGFKPSLTFQFAVYLKAQAPHRHRALGICRWPFRLKSLGAGAFEATYAGWLRPFRRGRQGHVIAWVAAASLFSVILGLCASSFSFLGAVRDVCQLLSPRGCPECMPASL